MTSIDYLIAKLKELHDSCSLLDIKYEYKSYLNTHVIDVRPKDFFENDDFYAALQLSLEDDFEELFPSEEILFISDNELINIDKAILELNSCDVNSISVEEFSEINFDEIYFDEFINIGSLFENVKYKSLNDLDFIEIDDEINSNITMEIPPPKPWWSLINKKSSKQELELFFV